MVWHDNKSVDFNSIVIYQKAQVFNDDLFVFIRLEQLFLPKNGGCEELDIMRVHE
jgi:hypothetical protein